MPYSRGWGLAQCLLCCAFSPHVIPASVSLPGPWWGMGMVTVTVVPGMRQGGARQAVNGVWAAGLRRGRRQGRAWNQMWRRRPGRPGGLHARPGAHMAGGCGRGPLGPATPGPSGENWTRDRMREGATQKPAPDRSCPSRAGDPPAPRVCLLKSCISCFKAESS